MTYFSCEEGWAVYDPILMITVLLLLMTMGVTALYYRRIKRVKEEYEKARDVVGDIIISFNRQLESHEGRIDEAARGTRGLSLRIKEVMRKIEAWERRLSNLVGKTKGASEIEQRILTRFGKVEENMKEVAGTQEVIMQKVEKLEKLERKIPAGPEQKIEAVIPLRREKVLAPLTETELRVLETLASEGGKTAPEIQERIQLSREHTSRLMKKLYEEGYLERDKKKIPYTYRIKEEMLRILRKREAEV